MGTFNSFFAIPFLLLFSYTQLKKKNQILFNPTNQNQSILSSSKMPDSSAPTLSFSNYTWLIKSGIATPGPNSWSSENAFVDSSGRLHLKITYNQATQKWDCAEIWTTESFGFGTYEWLIEGPIDKLDKNVVLGLFNYPASPKIPDGTNEIDIEFAKWGIDNNKPGNFTVWPAKLLAGYENHTQSFDFSLNDYKTTQRFTWDTQSIVFESLEGWDDESKKRISSKTYRTNNSNIYIPQSEEPVHINLWLFKGLPPSNNEPVEIIISRFQKK